MHYSAFALDEVLSTVLESKMTQPSSHHLRVTEYHLTWAAVIYLERGLSVKQTTDSKQPETTLTNTAHTSMTYRYHTPALSVFTLHSFYERVDCFSYGGSFDVNSTKHDSHDKSVLILIAIKSYCKLVVLSLKMNYTKPIPIKSSTLWMFRKL